MTSIEQAVRDSAVFLVLASENWLEGLEDPQESVRLQYDEMCRHRERPVLLVWLKDPDRAAIRAKFAGFATVEEVEYDEFESKGEAIIDRLTGTTRESRGAKA